jgi:hypothetical protein
MIINKYKYQTSEVFWVRPVLVRVLLPKLGSIDKMGSRFIKESKHGKKEQK